MLRTRGARSVSSIFTAQSSGPGAGAWTNGACGIFKPQLHDEWPNGCDCSRSAVADASRGHLWYRGLPFAALRRCSTSGAENLRSDRALAPAHISWIETNVPASALPYIHLARLHKPIGSWLLAWPCFWSIAMAAAPGQLPDVYMLTLYGTGAVLLRGAGCTINDMWDRKVDAQLNQCSQILGVASLPLIAVYPLMKRITNLAFLGLTINWGAIMGWASVRGSCEWPVVVPMYASAICWTLIYDTIYAHMDRADDTKTAAGLALGMGGLQGMSGVALGAGPAYYIGISGGISHVLWQIYDVDLDSPSACLQKFKSNTGMGTLPMAGIVLDRLWST